MTSRSKWRYYDNTDNDIDNDTDNNHYDSDDNFDKCCNFDKFGYGNCNDVYGMNVSAYTAIKWVSNRI
jgi:hypothetical protein